MLVNCYSYLRLATPWRRWTIPAGTYSQSRATCRGAPLRNAGTRQTWPRCWSSCFRIAAPKCKKNELSAVTITEFELPEWRRLHRTCMAVFFEHRRRSSIGPNSNWEEANRVCSWLRLVLRWTKRNYGTLLLTSLLARMRPKSKVLYTDSLLVSLNWPIRTSYLRT